MRMCNLRVQSYKLQNPGLRVQYACNILMTKFASRALYVVPSVRVKSEVYFRLNSWCLTCMLWQGQTDHLELNILCNDSWTGWTGIRTFAKYKVHPWILQCQSQVPQFNSGKALHTEEPILIYVSFNRYNIRKNLCKYLWENCNYTDSEIYFWLAYSNIQIGFSLYTNINNIWVTVIDIGCLWLHVLKSIMH